MPIAIGDILVSLNDISFKGMTVPEALETLKSSVGLSVLFIRKKASRLNLQNEILVQSTQSSIISQSSNIIVSCNNHLLG